MAVITLPADSVAVELAPSQPRIASGTGAASTMLARFRWPTFVLVVDSLAGGAGDTLDVYIQQSIDGGYNWDDVAHFAQVDGTSPAQAQAASLPEGRVEAGGEIHTYRDAALAAGSVVNTVLARAKFRARWVIGGALNVVFQVVAFPRP